MARSIPQSPDRGDDSLAMEADLHDGMLDVGVYPGSGRGVTVRRVISRPYDGAAVAALCGDLAGTLQRGTRRDPSASELRRQLARIGQRLFDTLLPDEVKDALTPRAGTLLYLHLSDGTVGLPWELLYDGERFLCERFAVGRLLKTRLQVKTPPRETRFPWRALVVGDPRGDLPSARAEARRMRDVLSIDPAQCRAELKTSRVTAAYILERIREYDLVHYAGHADYRAEDPSGSAWLLTDGPLEAQQVVDAAGGKASFPVLVFANACGTARTADWLAAEQRGVFGLGSAFLVAGVQHYIGTLAPVLDEGAADLAAAFYDHLREGRCVGEALRLARTACQTADGACNATGLSYIAYGNPGATLFATPSASQTRVEEAETAAACGVCGKAILSDLSAGGRCDVCGAPVCRRCWSAAGRRRCARHGATQPTAAAREPAAGQAVSRPALRCARCEKPIRDIGLAGGLCREAGCVLPICAACWASGEDARWCRAHTRSDSDRLADLRASLAEGRIDRLVTRDQALQRELGFLGRIELAVERADQFVDPATSRSRRLTVEALPTPTGPPAPAGGPANAVRRFLLKGTDILWDGGPVHLEARAFSHLDAHREDGADCQPAGVGDLNVLLRDAIVRAERDRVRILLVVGATADWSVEACQAVLGRSAHDAFANRSVAVALCDLHHGGAAYNAADRRVTALRHLFELETRDEQVARVMAYVEDRLADHPAVALHHAARACGVAEAIANAALERLAAEARYRIERLPDVGKVIAPPADFHWRRGRGS